MTDPANLNADDKALLDAISTRSPAIRALVGHVRAFATMMRRLTGSATFHNGSTGFRTTSCPNPR
jgi:hypothetical protein